MKNSTLLGSATSVLLAFSVISYAKSYIQYPKPAPQPNQTAKGQPTNQSALVSDEADAASEKPLMPGTAPAGVETKSAPGPAAEKSPATLNFPVQTYTATAYSLRGRTASGRMVAKGLIAADPRVLPLGTRVRIDAGEFSGEYVVADTGGAVKGRRVDIWTPTTREAMRFGRRSVKLTVLEVGGRSNRATSTRPRTTIPVTTPAVINPAPAPVSASPRK